MGGDAAAHRSPSASPFSPPPLAISIAIYRQHKGTAISSPSLGPLSAPNRELQLKLGIAKKKKKKKTFLGSTGFFFFLFLFLVFAEDRHHCSCALLVVGRAQCLLSTNGQVDPHPSFTHR